MVTSNVALILKAMTELQLNQQGLAELIGVSVRTLQRNIAFGGLTRQAHYERLVQALHARNPALAADIAASVNSSLPQLGVHTPATALPPPKATRAHAEAVVCAAADAMALVPRDARPAVAAIFSRVVELEVDLPSLVALLIEPQAAPKAKVQK